MAEEKIFLNENNVSVSNARMMCEDQTYAMSGITSVKTYEKKPSKLWAVLMILIGIGSLSSGRDNLIVGVIFIAGGVAWIVRAKPDYSVVLRSASGEEKAYTSKDKDFVNKIVSALNDAIVHRG